MATTLTPNLGLTTVEANNRLPEAAVNDNFDKLDSYVGAAKLTNKSGAQRVAGEVVVADTTADSSFTSTTTANASKVIGVVQETIEDDAAGIVKQHGSSLVKVTGATSRGDWLVTSTTEGAADPDSSADPPAGAFAVALTATVGAGTVTAVLMITAVLGSIALPSSAAPSISTEGVIEWESDEDVIVGYNGAAQKRLGLIVGAGKAAAVAGEMAYDTTAKELSLHDGSSEVTVPTNFAQLARLWIESNTHRAIAILGAAHDYTAYADGAHVGLGFNIRASGTSAAVSDSRGSWHGTSGAGTAGQAGIIGPNFAAADDPEMGSRAIVGAFGAGTDNFMFGLIPSASLIDANNIIAFRCLQAGAVANLFGICDSGGTETSRDTSFQPDGATEKRLRILVSGGGATVQFFMDGAQVGADVTSSIPSATGLMVGIGVYTNSNTEYVSDWSDTYARREA